jgi:lactate permease
MWPLLLVAGALLRAGQFVTSNYLGYELTDVGSSMISLLCTVAFLKVWKPAADPAFALDLDAAANATLRRAHHHPAVDDPDLAGLVCRGSSSRRR